MAIFVIIKYFQPISIKLLEKQSYELFIPY